MYLSILLCIAILNTNSYNFGAAIHVANDKAPFFRKDYVFNEDTQNFYKIHTIKRKWPDAVQRCKMEGATLFVPDTKLESDFVKDYVQKEYPEEHKTGRWIWIGIHDSFSEGDFVTVDGRSLRDIYVDWFDGEPNNAFNNENCVAMFRPEKSRMYDLGCDGAQSFICKKPRSTIEWNYFCDIPDTNYLYNKELGKCYKLHLTPKSWQDAYAVCTAEESYLAIINNQAEADYFVDLAKNENVKKISTTVHLGFINHFNVGWTTIKGLPLAEVGYTTWGRGEPNNGEGDETCGTMGLDGGLRDIRCAKPKAFMCEHDLDSLSSSVSERFNNVNTSCTVQ